MLMSEFWVKYVLRVAHISSMIAICHKTISDWTSGAVSGDHALFYTLMGVIAIGSGLINTFVLQPKKMGEKRKPWVGFHHLKFAITILLYLPTAKWLMSNEVLASTRMYWIFVIMVVSPYMRFYREKHSTVAKI